MTTDPPLFSIVTITKDNLAGLNITAVSIAHQSCPDYEWIVIDGHSSDGTKDFLATLPAQITSEPDAGIYDAMNKGIAMARGLYVLFLNAGDALADMDILSTLSRAARENPDFIYGDALETNGLYKKARSHENLDWGMFTHHQAMLYRRDLIGEARYDDTFKIAADYGFTVAHLRKARSVHYMPCAICVFDDGGVSQRNRALGRREQYRLRRKFGQCGLLRNCAVYALQSVSAALRDASPQTYLKIRGLMAR